MNPYNESEGIRSFGTTADHKAGTLSDVATTETLTAGWWKLTADQDYHWRGPDAVSTACTVSTGTLEWGKDTPPLIRVPHGGTLYVSTIKKSSGTSGLYYIDRVKGP